MPKKSYYEGWGYSDNVRLVVKGETKNRNDFYKEFKKSYPTEQIEKSGQKSVEAYVSETQVPMIKKLAKFFNLIVIYRDGGSTNNQEVARTILSQLGGQNKLVVMTGANTFVAIPNGLSFKIKNRKVNYIKITLNVNDLYDVVFGKILSGSLKVISEFKDIYNDQLKTLFEKETGMYLKLFRKGGVTNDDDMLNDLLFSEGGSTPEKLVYVLYGVKPMANELLTRNGIRNRSWWQSNLDLEKSKELLKQLKTDNLIKEYLIFVGDKSKLKFKDGGEIEEDDLFENYDKQPLKVQKILADFSEDDINDYEASERLITALNKVGYTCEYGMDGELFGLRKLTNEELVQKMKDGEIFAEGGNLPQGLSIADANPYIAGAKAVQGIAPSSVSALDQRIASRINPDPNRPVFFKTGGKTEKPIENKLKVGDIVVEFRKKFPNDSSKSQIGGAGKIIKIVDAMAKVYYKINDYEQWLPLKDLIKSNNI